MKLLESVKAVIWGDSVARGVVYDETRNRYTISKCAAAPSFAQRSGAELINRSRMGMTSVEGAEQMSFDLSRGMTADLALIGFGGNDSDFDWQSISDAPEKIHLPKTPMEKFEQTMKSMIRALQSRGTSVILTTLPPVISERYFHFVSQNGRNPANILRWLGTKNRISTFHDGYSRTVEKLAGECGCALVDLARAFAAEKKPEDLFCADGIHPNDRGQRLIADTMYSAICGAV